MRRSRFPECGSRPIFFPCLGWKPLLGRTFLAEEETLGKDHEVI